MSYTYFFYKQLGSGLSPQSCLYVQGFGGSKLLNGCFVVWPSNLCLQEIQQFRGFKIDFYPFKHQSHKMVKHTQTIRRQFADELFECVWPFCDIGA